MLNLFYPRFGNLKKNVFSVLGRKLTRLRFTEISICCLCQDHTLQQVLRRRNRRSLAHIHHISLISWRRWKKIQDQGRKIPLPFTMFEISHPFKKGKRKVFFHTHSRMILTLTHTFKKEKSLFLTYSMIISLPYTR